MKSPKFALVAAVGALLLSACEHYTQATSGADYLARYDASYTPLEGGGSDVDADVRRIAAVEPDIRFPARIGLARIEHGSLIGVPADEGYIWQALADELDPRFGEFVPVSPLIAATVAKPRAVDEYGYAAHSTQDVIANIRRGAARQHIDYVLVYEVGSSKLGKANAISLADLSIVGMFVLPSRSIEVEASASGILLDVRNGYPYATLTAHAEKNGLSRAVSEYSKTRELVDTAEELAVLNLSGDVKQAMEELAKVAAERTVSDTRDPGLEPSSLNEEQAWWEE